MQGVGSSNAQPIVHAGGGYSIVVGPIIHSVGRPTVPVL